MIDTEINYNDGAPFRVPGAGIFTTEREFTGATVPDTFRVFFGVDDSDHVAAATLRGSDATPPDRLIFAWWPQISNTLYDYAINESTALTGDSAYALYWYPVLLFPGNTRTFVTYYGLAELDVDLQPPLALGLTGPATLDVDAIAYDPNPFDITATVFNNGTATATEVQLTLNLTGTTGLTLEQGDATQAIGNLDVGEERQVTWRVRAAPQQFQTAISYAVVAAATNTEAKTVTRTIALSPVSTRSFYAFSEHDAPNISQGCAARRNGEQGLVVMIFGSPRLINQTEQGTRLLVGSNSEVTLDQVRRIVLAFARGYMGEGCDPAESPRPRDPGLTIIVATTNSTINNQDNPALTAEHGEAWADMIADMNAELRANYGRFVRAAAGYDAEPAWSSPTPTLAWANGYDQAARYPYFNIGSCDGCPRTAPRDAWDEQLVDYVYQLSWGINTARPFPQIYVRTQPYEWYNIKRYAQEQGDNMFIGGVMASCEVVRCDFYDPTPWRDKTVSKPLARGDFFSPVQAWQSLYELMNAPFTPEEGDDGQPLNRPNPLRQRQLPYITDFFNGPSS